MTSSNNLENNDISLYVPWNGNSFKMQEEYDTISSIHMKNLQKYKQLKDEIKNSLSVDLNPVRIGHCAELKERYLDEENQNLESFEKYNSEYNQLLEKEAQLHNEINTVSKNLKEIVSEMEELEEKEQKMKKMYQSHKGALNLAKNVYENAFGMEITTEGQDEGDNFTANVRFKDTNDCLVKFTIDRKLNQILDFDVNSPLIPPEELEELKSQFKETDNILGVICTLRNRVLNKV